MKYTPIIDRGHPGGMGGTQQVYRFPNGYGASVICTPYSYGGNRMLFELGVIVFDKEDDYHLTYKTPITDDVIGYLTERKVQNLLKKIEALPKAPKSRKKAHR